MKETNEYAGAPSSELIWFPYKWLHGIQFQKHSDNADYALGEFDMILNRFKNWPEDFAHMALHTGHADSDFLRQPKSGNGRGGQ